MRNDNEPELSVGFRGHHGWYPQAKKRADSDHPLEHCQQSADEQNKGKEEDNSKDTKLRVVNWRDWMVPAVEQLNQRRQHSYQAEKKHTELKQALHLHSIEVWLRS
jgi:hypothetical protein